MASLTFLRSLSPYSSYIEHYYNDDSKCSLLESSSKAKFMIVNCKKIKRNKNSHSFSASSTLSMFKTIHQNLPTTYLLALLIQVSIHESKLRGVELNIVICFLLLPNHCIISFIISLHRFMPEPDTLAYFFHIIYFRFPSHPYVVSCYNLQSFVGSGLT